MVGTAVVATKAMLCREDRQRAATAFELRCSWMPTL